MGRDGRISAGDFFCAAALADLWRGVRLHPMTR
jgi:hypothetical protein